MPSIFPYSTESWHIEVPPNCDKCSWYNLKVVRLIGCDVSYPNGKNDNFYMTLTRDRIIQRYVFFPFFVGLINSILLIGLTFASNFLSSEDSVISQVPFWMISSLGGDCRLNVLVPVQLFNGDIWLKTDELLQEKQSGWMTGIAAWPNDLVLKSWSKTYHDS